MDKVVIDAIQSIAKNVGMLSDIVIFAIYIVIGCKLLSLVSTVFSNKRIKKAEDSYKNIVQALENSRQEYLKLSAETRAEAEKYRKAIAKANAYTQ